MLIICDSSPIIALAIVDHLDLLEILFSKVVVPESVYSELCVSDKPLSLQIRRWAQDKIIKATDVHVIQAFNMVLDRGEAEALALYWELKADFLLIDERKGRKIAVYNNMKIIGSLGILLYAKQKGYLNTIKPSLDILQQSNIRISAELYKKALELAGE